MSASNGGRRGSTQEKKTFEDLSERQTGRRAEELISFETNKLLLAAAKSANISKKLDLEYVLRLLYKDHSTATKIRTLLKDEKLMVKPRKIDPLRGLQYLLDNNLTTAQYTNTRLISKEFAANIFPSYNKVFEAKKECRPSAGFEGNDVSATLPLQALLNHTAQRLLLLQEPVLAKLCDNNTNNITVKLQVKWGCDGSSDHSQYNQKYVNAESAKSSDSNFFATTLVPLRITTVHYLKTIIWNNAAPQSPRFCRPLRLHFAKEKDEFVLQEIHLVQTEIEALRPLVFTVAGIEVTLIYELYLTMIDGKTLATITSTKSKQRCCVCKATPKEFNKLHNMKVRFKPEDGTLNYGLSVLHLWIRSFEWLLHVSYRKNVETWQLRGAYLQNEAKRRKFKIQKRFEKKLNLKVDFPSRKGTGNSNTGNVCRAAFKDPKTLAKILNLDKKLIRNIRTILIAISCQLPLNVKRFHKLCKKTMYRYVRKYVWFPLPSSIHKLLVHSCDIMLASDLTVGVLAEDASESCNKLYRQNRQFHARKNSRENNLEDVFNRALDSSDPIIASFGLQKRQNARQRKHLPIEVLNLLEAPEEPLTKEQELEEIEDVDETEADLEHGLSEALVVTLDSLNLPEDSHYDDDVEYDNDGEESDEYSEEMDDSEESDDDSEESDDDSEESDDDSEESDDDSEESDEEDSDASR